MYLSKIKHLISNELMMMLFLCLEMNAGNDEGVQHILITKMLYAMRY